MRHGIFWDYNSSRERSVAEHADQSRLESMGKSDSVWEHEHWSIDLPGKRDVQRTIQRGRAIHGAKCSTGWSAELRVPNDRRPASDWTNENIWAPCQRKLDTDDSIGSADLLRASHSQRVIINAIIVGVRNININSKWNNLQQWID